MESCECVLANNHINHKVLSICFVFSFQFFLQLLCISLVALIFRYSARKCLILPQNARLKNSVFFSKFYRQNLSTPASWIYPGAHDISQCLRYAPKKLFYNVFFKDTSKTINTVICVVYSDKACCFSQSQCAQPLIDTVKRNITVRLLLSNSIVTKQSTAGARFLLHLQKYIYNCYCDSWLFNRTIF